jgi:hypothetical protein
VTIAAESLWREASVSDAVAEVSRDTHEGELETMGHLRGREGNGRGSGMLERYGRLPSGG